MKRKIKILNCILFFLFIGCTNIPPEAPELSVELGNRITAIEQANLTLLNRFFDLKRKEVERYIDEKWFPRHAKKLFTSKNMQSMWNTVVRENNPEQNLRFLLRIAPILQEDINKQRQEMMDPLNDLEKRIERELKREYNQAKSINNSITSFLFSASKVSENRDRYFQMLGIENDKIGDTIDKIDSSVSGLLSTGTNVSEEVDKYLSQLESIQNSIK